MLLLLTLGAQVTYTWRTLVKEMLGKRVSMSYPVLERRFASRVNVGSLKLV